MEKKVYIKDLTELMNTYQLCYIDEVPKTYWDLDPKSKALKETENYKEFRKKLDAFLEEVKIKHKEEKGYAYLTSEDYISAERKFDPKGLFKLEYCYYPHSDYEKGYTHYFYFTNDLKKQWGDDWDDAPYEYNAGGPYSSDTDIIIIPVCIEYFKLEHMVEVEKNWDDLQIVCPHFDDIEIKFPCTDFNNSPYSIDMINTGAIPWLYARIRQRKIVNPDLSISIMAGENPKSVLEKIDKFNHMIYLK